MITRKQLSQLIKVAHKGRIGDSSLSSQSGFTIVESLIAVIVAGILLAAIAPVITLAVATRVQARRVELATQAARTYIDGVRSGTIVPPLHVVSLNEVNSTTKAFSSNRVNFAGTGTPSTSSFSCGTSTTGYPYCTNSSTSSLYCIDRDGGGCSSSSLQDLVIQAFRSTTDTTNDDTNKGYLLSIRVYRTDAFNGRSLKTMASNNAKQNTFTGGLGDRLAPLVEITTEVVSKTTKYQDYCTRFGGCQ